MFKLLALAFYAANALGICPSAEAWLAGERATAAERQETIAMVQLTCEAMGASDKACRALHAVTIRESSGDRCAAHVQGRKEFGLGPHGLSVRWQLHRWDKTADPRVLHDPAVSTVVVLRLWRHANKTGAATWLDLQRVYSGNKGAARVGLPPGPADGKWCAKLKARNVRCTERVDDLGTLLGVTPYPHQREDLDEAIANHERKDVANG